MLSADDGGRSVIGWRAGADGVGERVEAKALGDASGEVLVDVAQVGHHPRADAGLLELRQLEHERVDDVRLLDRRLADVELAGLAVVVGETFRPDPLLRRRRSAGEGREPPTGSSRGPPSSPAHELGS